MRILRIPKIKDCVFLFISCSNKSEKRAIFYVLDKNSHFFLDVMDFSLKDSGFLSALPFVTIALILPFSGILADHLKSKGFLTLNQVSRKKHYFSFVNSALPYITH